MPRNISLAKIFENSWRPQAHCTGVVIYGIVEIYFFLDANVPKDSNTQRTTLMRSLEIAHEILQERGVDMPIDWILHVPLARKADFSLLDVGTLRYT